MFKPTPENLWQEIEAAEKVTKDRMANVPDLIRRLCGVKYSSTAGDRGLADPENHHYAFMANTLPDLAEDDPKVKVKAARVVGHRMVASAMQDGMQSWIEDVDYLETLEAIKLDYLLIRGVLLHNLKEDGRPGRGMITPRVTRLSPAQFFIDSQATDKKAAEFMGHWYFVDIDDLKADPDITTEARDYLEPDEGDATKHAPYPRQAGTELGRRRLKLYSVWMRATNSIRVMCEYGAKFEVYPERQYYGSEIGPYEVFDPYILPDETWGLGPMMAVDGQVEDLNIHARAMGRSAARRKSLGFVEANNADTGDVILKAEDGDILVVKGLTGAVAQMEVGGATPQQVQIVEYLRERLDRISGLTATAQGLVGKAKFATEVADASASLGKRSSYIRKRFMISVARSLWRVGWYLFNTEGIVLPVNRRDEFGRVSEGLFFGGPFPTDQGATWDDFQISIRINSMQRSAETAQKMQLFWQMAKDVIATALTVPGVQALNILEDMANALDIPDVIDTWINPMLFGQPPVTGQGLPSQVLGATPVPTRGGVAGPTGRRGNQNQGEALSGALGGQGGAPGGLGGLLPMGQGSGRPQPAGIGSEE